MLSDDPGPANLSFNGSTGTKTSECGMASGKIALDHRVKSARTVGRDIGCSRPRSSVADDMQARGGGGVRYEEAARLRNGLEEFVAAEGEPLHAVLKF